MDLSRGVDVILAVAAGRRRRHRRRGRRPSPAGGGGPVGSRSVDDDRPIGVFDSGLGGLTVVRALLDLLPDERRRLLRRHRPVPVRPEARRRGAEVLARDRRPAARARREDDRRRVQQRRRPPRSITCATRLDVPVIGVIEPGLRARAARDPDRAASA